MAHQNAEFAIDQGHGPSKHSLELSLFDTDMGMRKVKFRANGVWLDVQIISARRRNPAATIWDIEGIVETENVGRRISIYYLSDTREGRMRFEENLRTEGVMETPNDSRRASALMVTIERMVRLHKDTHLISDPKMFELFEQAKRIHRAEDCDSLTEAIKSI